MMLVELLPPDSIDTANLTGLGVGALLLALVFRTLWKQEGGWRSVLSASREDAAAARVDASTARLDAAMAREDARLARGAEQECHHRLAKVEIQMRDMAVLMSANTNRLNHLDSGEHQVVEATIHKPEELTE